MLLVFNHSLVQFLKWQIISSGIHYNPNLQDIHTLHSDLEAVKQQIRLWLLQLSYIKIMFWFVPSLCVR